MAFFSRNREKAERTEEKAAETVQEGDAKRIYLRNSEGEILTELLMNEEVLVTNSRLDDMIRLVKRKADNRETIVSFPNPDNAVVRKELLDILDYVVADIEEARLAGEDVTVPVNQYDLHAYLDRRPVQDVDTSRLETALEDERYRNGRESPAIVQFMDTVNRNKKIEIFYTANNLSDDTAVKLLQQAFRINKQIVFHDMTTEDHRVVFWTDPRIQKELQDLASAPMLIPVLGIGIYGRKAGNCIALNTTKKMSSLRKAAMLCRHPMTIREEMIDAQEMEHGMGVWKAGLARGKSEEFIRKYLLEIAVEEASYRIPAEIAQGIANRVNRTGYNEDQELGILRVDIIDKKMLLNMLRDAERGFAAEDPAGNFVCYHEATGELVRRYGWTEEGSGWVASPKGGNANIIRREVAQALLACRFVRNLNELLEKNKQKSVTEAYRSIRELVENYRDAGVSPEMQIGLLKIVKSIEENSYGNSIENLIREVADESA